MNDTLKKDEPTKKGQEKIGIKEKKLLRRTHQEGDVVISDGMYNLLIGAVIFYGVLLNVIIVRYFAPLFEKIPPIPFCIGYFVCFLTGVIIAYRSNRPSISFAGYHLIVLPLGASISLMVGEYTTETVFQVFLLTTLITAIMTLLGTAFPKLFLRLGGILFAVLLGYIVAELVCIFILHLYVEWFAWVGAILFTFYIAYDWAQAQNNVKTVDHAIDSALDIYMDIGLLFMKLLRIFGEKK